VIGVETTGAARYERNKGPGAHQRVHLRNILDAIMIRLVHGDHRDPRSQREKAKLLAWSKRCRCRWRARRGPGDTVRRKAARRFSPLISLGFGLCTVAPVIASAWRRQRVTAEDLSAVALLLNLRARFCSLETTRLFVAVQPHRPTIRLNRLTA